MLIGQILLQMITILCVVQLFGYICRRLGQQWVIGEILAGLALGPSLLGAFWPGLAKYIFPIGSLPTLQTLGELGLILYMFSLGARLEVGQVLKQGRSAVIISLNGILLPFLLGIVFASVLYPRLAGPTATPVSFLLIIGIAMSITAFPVLARLLAETNLLGTTVGTLALTCAAVDDITAWCLLALAIAVIHATGVFSMVSTIGFTLLFILVMFLVVRPMLKLAVSRIRSTPLLVSIVMILLMASAYITNAIGIYPIFGAFLLGIILPREAVLSQQVKSAEQVNNILFLPLYFVYTGLRTQIGLLHSPFLWLLCVVVLLLAMGGKISGSLLSSRLVGHTTWKEAWSIAFLMNTRGLVELIVLNIALDLGVLSSTLFSILVIMAVVTTMMASPFLAVLKRLEQNKGGHTSETHREELQEGLTQMAPGESLSDSFSNLKA